MAWTPEQSAAITARGASVVVSAAAGSGKTSVLTERIAASGSLISRPSCAAMLSGVPASRSGNTALASFAAGTIRISPS